MNLFVVAVLLFLPTIVGAKAGSPVPPAPVELYAKSHTAELERNQEIANKIMRGLLNELTNAWLYYEKWTDAERIFSKAKRVAWAEQLKPYGEYVSSDLVKELGLLLKQYQDVVAKHESAQASQKK